MRRRRQAIVLSVSAVFAILCPVVDGQLGIAIGLAPSAKYQTSYEPVYYTQTRKPAPVVKAVRAGIKLAGDVSSRIRTGIGQRVQALRNVLRVPPEKHIYPSSHSNSYSVDTYSPAPAYTSVVNSYDAPIVDSGYESILLEDDHASNFELNAPQPVPPPENFPANIEGGTGDETPFTPILKPEEVILLDEFSAPASQKEIAKEVIQRVLLQLKRVDQEKSKMSIEEKKRAAMELRERIRNKNKYYDQRGAVVTKDDLKRRPLVFMDIEVDGAAAGTIFIELFNETVPITAENFRLLATGELGFGYKGTVFHRIIPGFVMQGGDVTKKTTGDGQMSVYGPSFEDENFIVKHDSLGLLSMANEGPDTNGSQFFFTLAPALKMLDGRHVVFGRIYNEESYRLIERISEMAGTESGVTKAEVKIFNCGEYHNTKPVDTA